MGKIVIDRELKARFEIAKEQMEICDQEGNALGVFVPMGVFQSLERMKKIAYANVRIPFSEEEIARLRSQKEGSSLADFWKRMGHS